MSALVDTVPALELVDVRSGYEAEDVIHRVTLTVPAGAVTALLGPNGSGKTTLLRTISGFIPVRGGSVKLLGDDVTRRRPSTRFRGGLCLVPEGRGVFRNLTVRENLVVQSHRRHEERSIDLAIAAFPVLGRRLHQRAGTLSGGEQQMLAVSAAYVRDPRVVLIDEVSLGLAPLVVDEIFHFLADIASKGTSLLLVDQYAHRVLDLAVHAYVLRRGRILYSGSANELAQTDLFERYLGADVD
jgi:branched-chain amino acid transport system ATP-binding protein